MILRIIFVQQGSSWQIVELIKVLVATDDKIFQEGLCHFLEAEGDIVCMAKAANGEESVRLAQELQPDVAVIDVGMPLADSTQASGHAAEIANQIRAVSPATMMLMVSSYGYQPGILASLQAGVAGYLLKKTSPHDLVSAVRTLCSGHAIFDLEVVSKLIANLPATRDVPTGGVPQLRPREIEVLRAAANGLGNKEIAGELGISERTVQTHMVNIFRKLGVSSRTEAVLHALRHGWLVLDDLPL